MPVDLNCAYYKGDLKNLFDASDRSFLSILREAVLICAEQMSVTAILTEIRSSC